MIASKLSKQIFNITKKSDLEQSLKMIFPEYLKLKIYFIKFQIAQFEMKWNMTYEEFEEKTEEIPNAFSQKTEEEYYEWGEKMALLKHYQKNLNEWI